MNRPFSLGSRGCSVVYLIATHVLGGRRDRSAPGLTEPTPSRSIRLAQRTASSSGCPWPSVFEQVPDLALVGVQPLEHPGVAECLPGLRQELPHLLREVLARVLR